MRAKQPPHLATLMLERLGPQNDALVGDLAEEYRRGRSVSWYWWQVLTSVLIGAVRELWFHKWLGVQAVATYMGVQMFMGYLWRNLWYHTTLSTRVQEFTESVWGPQDPHVNAPYRWIVTIALIPVPIIIGWILAKLHQDQRGAAVTACCFVVMAMELPRLMQLTTIGLSEPERVMNMYLHVAMIVVVAAGMVAGTVMASSQERPTTSRLLD